MKTTNSGIITKFKEVSTAFLCSFGADTISFNKRNKINSIKAMYPDLGIPIAVGIILISILTPIHVFFPSYMSENFIIAIMSMNFSIDT
jgi:hypothetical protein